MTLVAEHASNGAGMRHGWALAGTVIVALAVGLTVSGCSVLAHMSGRFEDPTLELYASKVEDVSLDNVDLRFTVTIHNRNAFALRTSPLRYRLSVNQTIVAEGTGAETISVPADASVAEDLAIDVARSSLSNAASDAMLLGEIPYELDLWLPVDGWFSRREIHVRSSSVLRLNLPLGLACIDAVAFPLAGWQS